MNHKNNFRTGITVFFVLLTGSALITYLFLAQQPAVTPKSLTNISQSSHNKSSPKPVAASNHAKIRTKDSSKNASPPKEKELEKPRLSLAHASTVSTATSPKIMVQGKAFHKENGEKKTLTLADLQFGVSRTGLQSQTKAILDTYAKRMQDPQWSVLIQGHTDETGSIRKNLYVGLLRANAVKDYLIAKGIAKDRLHAVSLGEYQPVCINKTPACQLQNRRVSFALARREGIKAQNAVTPPAQEQVTHTEKNKVSTGRIEQLLVSLPEIYADTSDTPAKMELVYPMPVHSTPPPSAGQK
jgi:outer membrane protein OmpA-like peptidoglycan-associated protein